ncbi:MAG TPA: glycosyltransferase family 9 protein, partial [Chloroflexota bacterium]|nr:glycosyltransferase family 9 protein [Chloroflexota bacterium]
LGGVLSATPALRLIKEALPTAHLTVLAGPWGADVAEHCPAVDRVRTCRFPAFDRQRAAGGLMGKLAPYSLLMNTATELREERFDVALCLVADHWSAALTAVAGIPHRFGFETPDATQFLTHTLSLVPLAVGKSGQSAPKEHVASAQIRMAKAMVGLAGRESPGTFDERTQYEPSPKDRADAVRIWHAHDLEGRTPVVAIHPAPGGPAKRWPVERFAFVADHLVGRFGARIVVTGGPDDVDEARVLAASCRHQPTVLAGRTTFGALAAIYERCRFAMGTDNGAMHLATARSVPTIRLFGPVDHHVWSGWTGRGNTPLTISVASPRPCSPCHRLDLPEWEAVAPGGGNAYPCMQDISVDDVIRVVEEMWSRTA